METSVKATERNYHVGEMLVGGTTVAEYYSHTGMWPPASSCTLEIAFMLLISVKLMLPSSSDAPFQRLIVTNLHIYAA